MKMRSFEFVLSLYLVAVWLLLCPGCSRPTPAPAKSSSSAKTATAKHIYDLGGQPVDPFATSAKARARVFVFLTTDCPIANRYAPTLQRIAKECDDRNISFWLVYPNVDCTSEKIQQHMNEYGHTCSGLRDVDHVLVERTGVTVTPEAAVFTTDGTMAYRGRIDDWYVDFGKNRPEPSVHDLRDAIDAVVNGEAIREPRTKAVGCYIPELGE